MKKDDYDKSLKKIIRLLREIDGKVSYLIEKSREDFYGQWREN